MTQYHIYCDESCHLQHDKIDLMVLGAMSCPSERKKSIFEDIRDIKKRHGISSFFEIKWVKVSEAKIGFYKELIDYFWDCDDLSFRGLVATGKLSLDHDAFNGGDFDDWYYKMFYLLLDPLISPSERYRLFIDVKDTRGGPRTRKLKEVLCNNKYDFKQEVIKDVMQINSKESEILQLADLFIGSLSFFHRGLYRNVEQSLGKRMLIDHILSKEIDYNHSTAKCETKLNIFIWTPRRFKNDTN